MSRQTALTLALLSLSAHAHAQTVDTDNTVNCTCAGKEVHEPTDCDKLMQLEHKVDRQIREVDSLIERLNQHAVQQAAANASQSHVGPPFLEPEPEDPESSKEPEEPKQEEARDWETASLVDNEFEE